MNPFAALQSKPNRCRTDLCSNTWNRAKDTRFESEPLVEEANIGYHVWVVVFPVLLVHDKEKDHGTKDTCETHK